ncbi:conserved hypothetical protein, partial [Ricinus communis]
MQAGDLVNDDHRRPCPQAPDRPGPAAVAKLELGKPLEHVAHRPAPRSSASACLRPDQKLLDLALRRQPHRHRQGPRAEGRVETMPGHAAAHLDALAVEHAQRSKRGKALLEVGQARGREPGLAVGGQQGRIDRPRLQLGHQSARRRRRAGRGPQQEGDALRDGRLRLAEVGVRHHRHRPLLAWPDDVAGQDARQHAAVADAGNPVTHLDRNAQAIAGGRPARQVDRSGHRVPRRGFQQLTTDHRPVPACEIRRRHGQLGRAEQPARPFLVGQDHRPQAIAGVVAG